MENRKRVFGRKAWGYVAEVLKQIELSDVDGNPFTLITLSNLIDVFGINSMYQAWATYRFYDFNNNSMIDISDIAYVASRIVL